MIVTPDRETPGMSASACAKPTSTAAPKPRPAIVRRSGVRSASQSKTAEDGEQDRDLPRLAEVLGDRVLGERRR